MGAAASQAFVRAACLAGALVLNCCLIASTSSRLIWMRNPDFPEPGTGPDALFGALPETVLCGGYYFVPAVHSRPWTCILPE